MSTPIGQLSDTELMELVKQSDFAAFDEVYRRYHERIYRFLLSLTWDQDTAQDFAQEVFYRLYKARQRYVPTAKLSTYLYRIARNCYLSERRKGHLQLVSLDDEASRRPIERIRASERVDPQIHLLEEYKRWRIRQAILALPDQQKMVFVLAHFEDMKYARISEVLGVPVGTVKSRMFLAVKRLRGFLKEEDDGL